MPENFEKLNRTLLIISNELLNADLASRKKIIENTSDFHSKNEEEKIELLREDGKSNRRIKSLEFLSDALQDQHPRNLERKIEILFRAISCCSLISQEISSNKSGINAAKDLIIDLIKSDREICEAENLEQSPIPKLLVGETYLSEGRLIKDLTKKSLLCSLFSAIPSEYSADIILALIKECTNLRQRDDLLLMMTGQATIASDPDMTNIFHSLVSKGLPAPSIKQIEFLMTNSRMSSGQNASKLAAEFLLQNHDSFLVKTILKYEPCSPNELNIKKNITHEKARLRENLTNHKITDPRLFEVLVYCFLDCQDDESLKKLLQNNPQSAQNIEDHTDILEKATNEKLTTTFKILISGGFNPLWHASGRCSAFSSACKNQSRIPLESYLNTIAAKYGEGVVATLINEEDYEGKTALTHAVEGRAYVDAIDLLLKRGSDPKINNRHNLTAAAEKGDVGTFAILLEQSSISELDLREFARTEITRCSYAINSVLLEHFEGSTTRDEILIKSLKEQIEEKRKDLKESDIYEICKVSGGKTLEYFVKNMQLQNASYRLDERRVNQLDQDDRSLLFYAISGNAYNRMVQTLLDCGANPDTECKIEQQSDSVNALTLAVMRKESDTVRILLQSGKLKQSASFQKAALEMIKPENKNKLLLQAFVENLPEERLSDLPASQKKILCIRCFEADLEDCSIKIFNSFRDKSNILDSFVCNAISERDAIMLEKLLNIPNAAKLLNQYAETELTRQQTMEIEAKEKTSLLVRQVNGKSYSSIQTSESLPTPNTMFSCKTTRKLDQPNTKYLDLALKTSEENPKEKAQTKIIVKLLENKGFKTSWSKGQRAEIGLPAFSFCPDSCTIS